MTDTRPPEHDGTAISWDTEPVAAQRFELAVLFAVPALGFLVGVLWVLYYGWILP